MGFFLLERGDETGDLRLISDELFATRKQALDALTALSAQPGFEHRDAEVFVVDLDTATPVLLVATAAPAPTDAPAPDVPEPVEEVAVDAPADEAPDVEPAAEELSAEAEPVAEEPAEADAPGDTLTADAGVWETPVEAVSAIDDETVPASAEEMTDESSEEPGSDLAGALKRAAGALESEGIVAPESIGPAEVAAQAEDVAGEPAGTDEIVEAPAPADASWPWDTAAPQGEAEAPAAYVPDPFEEPAADAGDLVAVKADDETVALGRPVIMGAYSDDAPIPEVATSAADVPATEDEGWRSSAAPESTDVADMEIEGILADLEPIDSPPLVTPVTEEGVGLQCTDCVYDNTCPNKGDLDPSSCGNFQWRSA